MKTKIYKFLKFLYIKSFKYNFFLKLICYFYVFIILINNIKRLNYKKKKLLLITAERFRGDIAFLKKNYSILYFPKFFQNLLLFPITISKDDLYFKKLNQDHINDIKTYICNPINNIKKLLSISGIISPSIHYYGDNIIFNAAKLINLKTIVIHRENFGFEPLPSKLMINYYSKFQNSNLDIIFTYNDYMTKELSNLKIFKNTKIITAGSERGYLFYNKVKNIKIMQKKRIKIVFLSFTKNTGIAFQKNGKFISALNDDDNLKEFFINSHNSLINFANKNENYELLIKPKWKGSEKEIIGNWYKFNNERIKKNIIISSDLNFYEIIQDANVIFAFGASSILESGILNIPVVIPFFDEVKKYQEYFNLKEYRNSYIVWEDPKNLEFIKEVTSKNLTINKEKFKNRKKLFEQYIYNFNTLPKKIIIDEINKQIDSK